ncbi:hypothetical protein GGF31_008380 [Allomyces arbusculus]|nr:hypothetical protein GGF31_008380 [Allomyces arbusculus]
MARSKALGAIARPVADALHAATAAAAAVPGATPTNPPSPPSVPSAVFESALSPPTADPTTINEVHVQVPTGRAAPSIIPTIDGDLPITDLHPLVSTPRRTYTPTQLQAAALFFGRPANLVRSVTSLDPPRTEPDFPGAIPAPAPEHETVGPYLGGVPEVAFLGASNAGKSSLLRALMTKSSAKAAGLVGSQRAGATTSLNFYRVMHDPLMVVDMMGYGVGSRREWGKVIETYLAQRKELKRVYWLISAPSLLDTRFELADYDRAILDLVTAVRVPFTAVLTKIDVIPSTSAFLRCNDTLHRDLLDCAQGLGDTVLCTSAKSKITPAWDVRALGDPDLVRSVAPQLSAGPAPPVLQSLGLVSAMSDQARVEDGTVLLTRPGIAAVQAHILHATGQKMARWEGKVTKLAAPKVPPAVDLMAMKREIGKAQKKAKKAKRR